MNVNMNKIMQHMFRPIDSVVWDLMNNATGIRANDGIYTLSEDGTVDLNPFDSFSVELPAFSQTIALGDVKKGDVIVNNGKATGWVIEGLLADDGAERRTIKAISMSGVESNYRPKNISALGIKNGITVVRSPFEFGGEKSSGNAMSAMLPLLLMSKDGLGGGKGGIDMKTMLMMQMMGGMGGSGGMGGMNPMMLMMLLGDEAETPFAKR